MTTDTVALPHPLVAENSGHASTSRLTTAMLIAFAIHLILILGISFIFPEVSPGRRAAHSLEVIVLRQAAPSDEKPESADALAQVDREGGGADEPRATDVKAMPELPAPESEPLGIDSFPPPILPPLPEPRPALEEQEPTAPTDNALIEQPPPPILLTRDEPDPDPRVRPPEPVKAPDIEPPPPEVTTAQILASRNLEIAALSARIQDSSVAYAKRPRRKAISASTREYKYASYLEAWRRKVERIGNLNYPEEAKRYKMYGNLILHAAIRADGSIEGVRVLRSSGFELLDEAAVKIVELAAPYAPFPPDIRAETDVLDITRTWQFLSSNRLGWDN